MKRSLVFVLVVALVASILPPTTFASTSDPLADAKPLAVADRFSDPEIKPISLNRFLGYKNTNRDPDWDWTQNVAYTLQSTNQTFSNIRLPYYATQGPAAAIFNDSAGRDIAPEDGWVLMLRDFGPGIETPFFILYNKYRGIMRFFYFPTLPQTFTRAIARLSFQTQTTDRSAAHFTFLDKNRFVDNYDPARSQIVVGRIAPRQWCYFDFDVSGYDPAISTKDDPTFYLEVAGVIETDLTATGEVDLLTGPVSAAKSGSGFNVAGAFKNIKKRHKDVKDAKKVISDLADNNSGAWWSGPVKAIKNLTEKSWFGALGPVAGFLEFVIGGGSRKSTLPAPMTTKGTVELNGTLASETLLYDLIVLVPGGNHLTPATDALSNKLPLYDEPLGVLNVTGRPTYSGTVTTDSVQIIPTGPWNISATTSATTPLQIVYNTTVFSSANVTATWAPLNHPAYGYRSVSSFNSSWSSSFSGGAADEDLYIDLISGAYFSRIAIKARLTPRNAASGLEPVTLYKAYSTFANTTLRYEPPTGGGGGGGPGPGDGCIICLTAPTDTLQAELDSALLKRGKAQATTVDEHVADYLLVLLPQLDRHAEAGTALEATRAAYRDRLELAGGDSDSWSDADLRLLESLALRALDDRLKASPDAAP